MAIRKFSTASVKTGSKSSKFWDQTTTPFDYHLIESQTVGVGGASSVTLGSGGTIPQTYTHLELRFSLKSTNTANDGTQLVIKLNGDTNELNYVVTGVYSQRNNTDDWADTTITSPAGSFYWWSVNTSKTGNEDRFSPGELVIYDYKSTEKFKTMYLQAGFHFGTSSAQHTVQKLDWYNISPVTSITVSVNGDSIAQYSTIDLYGVK